MARPTSDSGDGMTNSRVQRLEDREEIAGLLGRYCIALDRMELDDLARLFTDDCSVAYGPDPLLQSEGSAALARSLERLWRWKRTSHHLSNVVIDFNGDNSADATSHVLAWHEHPDGSTATVFGQYLDKVVRIDGRWRIHRRRMVMNGSDAGFSVKLFPATRRKPPPGWVAPEL